ncbi:hypothetical protein AVEN_200432-1 [Araneus ventricosus]|uniref:Uncharacterized protein n=1 Tax=Araneus ventricosus TaxID=182803 RepID=A0A4Y2LJJ3_ARAVE|nr:hypothetical protein AVEN_156230-1 [Araneus ventricosus]GBN14724.1 hypothetical protein AVEN_200432-1 [Araneus ventricosus]
MPFESAKQLIMMVFFQLLRDPMNQINGIKSIYNFQGTLPYMKYCTPKNLYLFYNAAIVSKRFYYWSKLMSSKIRYSSVNTTRLHDLHLAPTRGHHEYVDEKLPDK